MSSKSTVDFSHVVVGAGTYRVVVTMQGEQVEGSPFDVRIRGSKAGATRCVSYGDGLHVGRVDQICEFHVCVCDGLLSQDHQKELRN